jgi:signal peptidase II
MMDDDRERETDLVTGDPLDDSSSGVAPDGVAASDGAAASDRAPAAGDAVRRRRWIRVSRLSVAVGLVIVVLDQLTKHWALNALGDGREVHVVWTLQWNLSFNTGMAFSRGEGLGPVIGLLAMLIVIVLVVSSAHVESRFARFAAGLLIGGALGNLVDRVFRGDGWLHGAVVDFIDFQWFPIFNVADMGITCGAVLFAIASLREGGRDDVPGRTPEDAAA